MQAGGKHVVAAALARQHKVFIERRLHSSCIGKTQNRIGPQYGVSHADTWLSLTGNRQRVVNIPAHPDVEEPVLEGDLVLNIEGQFLHIGVTVVVI